MTAPRLYSVTAHVDEKKVHYLCEVIRSISKLPIETDFVILTNLEVKNYSEFLMRSLGDIDSKCRIKVINQDFDQLESPWLITWAHKALIKDAYESKRYTHYMYLEDDMRFSTENLIYWLKGRELLRSTGCFPSFLRIEWSKTEARWNLLDFVAGDSFPLDSLPRIDTGDGRVFASLPRNYQGMFFYDNDLMEEHVSSRLFWLRDAVPDWREKIKHHEWPLGLTEAANSGVSLSNVPKGLTGRNLAPVFISTRLFDPGCFIHHLPDKYANSTGNIGKVPINGLIT
jgi:hypothetical protein